MTIHNFGSINVDHVYRVPRLVAPGETLSSRALRIVLGGKGANQSVALARAGATVRHVGRVGEADDWARAALAEAGVDVAAVERVAGPSGHAIIQVDDAGENAIVLHGGANHGFDRAALETGLAPAVAGDRLLLQNETDGIAEAFAVARARDLRIAFNPAPMDGTVHTLPLEHCETLILNETEAAMLAGASRDDDVDAIEAVLSARYPGVRLVLTLGARGARLVRGGHRLTVAAVPVDVVDTTGAGDTFVGYLLAALDAGMNEQDALTRACTAAALAVTQAGATPAIPHSRDVDDVPTPER